MQPGVAGGFDAVGQQRIVGVIEVTTVETAPCQRVRRIAVQPLDDAAGKRLGLGLRPRQSRVELDDACPLVEEDLPVLGRPAVTAGPKQRHNLGLVTGQEIDHGSWRRHRRRQNQVFAVDTELDAGSPRRLQSVSRAHIRPLQRVTVFSTDGAEGGEGVKGGDLTATTRHAVRPSASPC